MAPGHSLELADEQSTPIVYTPGFMVVPRLKEAAEKHAPHTIDVGAASLTVLNLLCRGSVWPVTYFADSDIRTRMYPDVTRFPTTLGGWPSDFADALNAGCDWPAGVEEQMKPESAVLLQGLLETVRHGLKHSPSRTSAPRPRVATPQQQLCTLARHMDETTFRMLPGRTRRILERTLPGCLQETSVAPPPVFMNPVMMRDAENPGTLAKLSKAFAEARGLAAVGHSFLACTVFAYDDSGLLYVLSYTDLCPERGGQQAAMRACMSRRASKAVDCVEVKPVAPTELAGLQPQPADQAADSSPQCEMGQPKRTKAAFAKSAAVLAALASAASSVVHTQDVPGVVLPEHT